MKWFFNIFSILVTFTLGYSFSSRALVVYFDGLPDSYSVYRWDNERNNIEKDPLYKSGQFRRIRFDIPDEFIERSANGEINLSQTLENWRKGTDVGFMLPKTYSSGLARFPFKIDNGELDKRAPSRNVYYIGVQELLQNIDKYPNVKFGSADKTEKLYAENLGLIEKVRKISESNISCRGSRDTVASWPAEQCLMCNCANEGLAKDVTGQTMIAQVVFRRVVSKYFPQHPRRVKNNICGIVADPSQFSWVGIPNQKTITKNSIYMKNCMKSTIDAINAGPGRYDHYHNTSVRPAWAKSYKEKTKSIGNHYFYRRLPDSNVALTTLKREFNSGGGKSIYRPLEIVDKYQEDIELHDLGTE